MRTVLIIAAILVSAYVIYWVATNIQKQLKKQEEAAGKIGKEKKKASGQGGLWNLASSVIDPFGITSGVK